MSEQVKFDPAAALVECNRSFPSLFAVVVHLRAAVAEVERLQTIDEIYEKAYFVIGACDISDFLARCSNYEATVEENDRLRDRVTELETLLASYNKDKE